MKAPLITNPLKDLESVKSSFLFATALSLNFKIFAKIRNIKKNSICEFFTLNVLRLTVFYLVSRIIFTNVALVKKGALTGPCGSPGPSEIGKSNMMLFVIKYVLEKFKCKFVIAYGFNKNCKTNNKFSKLK